MEKQPLPSESAPPTPGSDSSGNTEQIDKKATAGFGGLIVSLHPLFCFALS